MKVSSSIDCQQAILQADANGDHMLDQDREYTIYLHHMFPDLQHLDIYQEFPILQETFMIFTGNNDQINITELIEGNLLNEFCDRTLASVAFITTRSRYHRRLQVAPNAAPAAAPNDSQLFRPSINQENSPVDVPSMPITSGGITLPSMVNPTPATIVSAPSYAPTVLPINTPLPTNDMGISSPQPTVVVEAPSVPSIQTGEPSLSTETTPTSPSSLDPGALEECYTQVKFADANGDGRLTRREYVTLVNSIANQRIASSFLDLPESLRDLFHHDFAYQGEILLLFDNPPNDDRRRRELNNIFKQGDERDDEPMDDEEKMIPVDIVCLETKLILESLMLEGIPTMAPITLIPTNSPDDNNTPKATTAPTFSSNSMEQPQQLPTDINPPSTADSNNNVKENDEDISDCLEALAFADLDRDGTFNEREYLEFINVLANRQVAMTFGGLTEELQNLFMEIPTEGFGIDVDDSESDTESDQYSALRAFCTIARTRVEALATSSGDNIGRDNNVTNLLLISATSSPTVSQAPMPVDPLIGTPTANPTSPVPLPSVEVSATGDVTVPVEEEEEVDISVLPETLINQSSAANVGLRLVVGLIVWSLILVNPV